MTKESNGGAIVRESGEVVSCSLLYREVGESSQPASELGLRHLPQALVID
jgi:hypothetical protein